MEEREITFLFSFYIFLRKLPEGEVFTWRCFLFLRLLLEKEERERKMELLGVCKELL